jgi:hypothetical protein
VMFMFHSKRHVAFDKGAKLPGGAAAVNKL